MLRMADDEFDRIVKHHRRDVWINRGLATLVGLSLAVLIVYVMFTSGIEGEPW